MRASKALPILLVLINKEGGGAKGDGMGGGQTFLFKGVKLIFFLEGGVPQKILQSRVCFVNIHAPLQYTYKDLP